MKFTTALILFLVLNFGALGVGTLLMDNGPQSLWYTSLNQAPWTPMGWVFGAAWTCVMIFFSVFMSFFIQNENLKKVFILYAIQFVLNISWNYIFFNQQLTELGLLILVLLTLLTFYFFIAFKSILNNNRYFVLPYCVWLLVALSLNAYIVAYN
jgi:tryptophan-rich sensory protein